MILLIGATSFIGVHTVTELLNRGCKVAVTGRNDKFKNYYDSLQVPYYHLDLCDKEDYGALPEKDIESIVLLAGLLPANVRVDLDKEENAEDYCTVISDFAAPLFPKSLHF